MKKFILVLILCCCTELALYAQPGMAASLNNIPVELYLQIGFLFVYVLLGLLFFMIYVFSPRELLNLFFSLYNISLALTTLTLQYLKGDTLNIAINITSRLIGANILLFILHALGRMKSLYYWYVAFALLIDIPLAVLLRNSNSIIPEILHVSFPLICLYHGISAFKNKKPGDWLIGMVALAVAVINLSVILNFFFSIQLVSYAAMGIIQFTITLSVIVYLSLRYGRVNSNLQQQLVRVQVLSDENLKSEKEKQQMLAGQNEQLEKEVTERTKALTKSLSDLRSTQTQLIQSEKMASLGELTAGIAHEIQNPLNFVNNFSDVNKEMLEELKAERLKPTAERDKNLEATIINDVIDNEQKINHHGKRADAIVKGMLQHSRVSTSKKESTDLNALADEYLRLTYQGQRAKDKTFNVKLITNFDPLVETVNIIRQDIGRVLLNLYNNAFYAVRQRKNQESEEFDPTIQVTTQRLANHVEICIEDNGTGISQNIIDKIFQPFFTTKPTGQGTGLGLSLSYDIIKAHGGELKVETKEGEGADFFIELPA